MDIWRKVGATAKPYTYDFNQKVEDGQLDITFKPIVGKTILSAVEIIPRKLTDRTAQIEPSATTPPPVTNPSTPRPSPASTPQSAPVIPAPSAPVITTTHGGRQVNVSNSEQLTQALATAKAGDTIRLADGVYQSKKAIGRYTGSFGITSSGTAAQPIVLQGSRQAIITGNGTGGNYGLYMVGAKYWVIKGLTVTDATKGIVLDGSNNTVFDGVLISKIGQEGIHFRANSSDNTIQNSEISYTGLTNAAYGEGVYIGSANSNWGTYNNGNPDKADRNRVIDTNIKFTGAESIDIKEGSSNGVISGNSFDGRGMTGAYADSWIDIKGNGYRIVNNNGVNALLDGLQVHVALAGWGNNNYIGDNSLDVNARGVGFSMQSGGTGNVWACSNIVKRATGGTATANGRPLACVNQ